MNNIIIKRLIAQQKTLDKIQLRQNNTNNYSVDPTVYESGLTLTRTSTLSLTANVQQAIVWETEIRNTTNTINQIPFTWAGSVITIPQNGYYQMHFFGEFPLSAVGVRFDVAIVGYNYALSFNMYPQNPKQARFRQYLFADDTVEFLVTSISLNNTLAVNPEFSASQSPILYITRISP